MEENKNETIHKLSGVDNFWSFGLKSSIFFYFENSFPRFLWKSGKLFSTKSWIELMWKVEYHIIGKLVSIDFVENWFPCDSVETWFREIREKLNFIEFLESWISLNFWKVEFRWIYGKLNFCRKLNYKGLWKTEFHEICGKLNFIEFVETWIPCKCRELNSIRYVENWIS